MHGGGIHVRPVRTLLTVALVATLLMTAAPVSAEVTWEHTLADPADDVVSVLEPTVKRSDKGEVDIISASITEQGEDLNVTLTLAGARDSEANYEVSVTCDDDDAKGYTFTYSFGVFSITGFDLVEDSPEAYISPDQRMISWVLDKDKVSATDKVEVTHAQAMVFSGITNYIDTAPDGGNGGGNGNGGGGSEGPLNVQVSIEFRSLERVVHTIEVTIEGDDAKDLRGEFDLDVDGTVTKDEYDQHITFFHLTYGSWNTTDLELDGEAPASKAMTFQLQGVVGSATSTSPIVQVVELDVRFDEPAEAGTHTYADFRSTGDEAGDMWDVTPDSLWTVSAPPGWRFKTEDWPAGARTYIGSKGSTVTLSGLQMASDWNETIGLMNSLVITERAEPNEEDTPGLGIVLTVTGLFAVSVLMARSRGRR
jgi:hypothetical protein